MEKKWVFIVLALVLVAGLVGYFAAGFAKSPEEKALDKVLPKTQSAKSAPGIADVSVQGLKTESEVIADHWERGVLSLRVKVTNAGTQTLLTAKLNVTVVDSSGDKGLVSSVSVNRLKPGETITLNLEMLPVINTSNIKKVEVTFDGRSIYWDSVATPTKPVAQPSPVGGQNVYTAVPKNPTKPAEVVAAFAFLCDQGKYAEAKSFLTQKFIKNYGEPQRVWSSIAKGKKLDSVEILRSGNESSGRATIEARFHFKDGSSFVSDVGLVEDDNKWKMNE